LAWVNKVLARNTSKFRKASKANQLHTFAVGQSVLEYAHQGNDQDGGLGCAVLGTGGNGMDELGFVHAKSFDRELKITVWLLCGITPT